MIRRYEPSPVVFDYGRTYYLSGPMSGYPAYNYPAFHAAAHELRISGIKIESPAENPWPKDPENYTEEQFWHYRMELSLAQMHRCQGIILLQGWPYSRGARIELDVMAKRKLPVWYYNNWSLVRMGVSDG